MIRGRTTFTMSVEVPASKRIAIDDLQPGDVIFFGAAGPRSQPGRSTTQRSISRQLVRPILGQRRRRRPARGLVQKRFAWAGDRWPRPG